jgi:hypothetical protein
MCAIYGAASMWQCQVLQLLARHMHAGLTHACMPLLCRLGPRMGPEDAGGMPTSAAMLAAGSASNMPRELQRLQLGGALGGQAAGRSAGMALIGWRTRRGVALDICNLPGGCCSGCAGARLLSMCSRCACATIATCLL